MLRNWKRWVTLGIAIICFASFTYAETSFSLTIGTDNFYASVGNYDYFPYAYSQSGYGGYNVPRINFYDVMADYGTWVEVSPFGHVWRPYASSTWRPYVQGHWVYTSYGPTWVGYEPWAWAGYHYGNWIWTQRYGWVWIPGYDWHPGRVMWSHGYDAIGWMPAPPTGYDYSRGYLSYQGEYNQFAYNDRDFDYNNDDYGYGQDDYYYGGPYYDSRYRDLYYNPGYRNIVINLWVFIGTDHFGYNNYCDYYLDRDFTRNVFERRLVRISSRPLDRPVMERVIKQRIREVSVQVKEIDTDKQRIKMIVPEGEDKDIRENANRVVKDVIAPGFVHERKNFRGLKAQNAQLVNKMFQQENKRPEVKNVSGDEIVREANTVETQREERRGKLVREKADRVIQIEKEGKVHEARDRNRNSDKGNNDNERDNQINERNQDRNPDNNRAREADKDRDQQFEKRSSDKEKERGNTEKQQRDVEQKKRDFDSQIQNDRERSRKQKDEEEQPRQNQDQDQERTKQRNADRDRQRNDEDQKINDRRLDDRDKDRDSQNEQLNRKPDKNESSDTDVRKKDNEDDKKSDRTKDQKEDSGKKDKKSNKDKKHNQNGNDNGNDGPDNNR